jgi:hypothetical protein
MSSDTILSDSNRILIGSDGTQLSDCSTWELERIFAGVYFRHKWQQGFMKGCLDESLIMVNDKKGL